MKKKAQKLLLADGIDSCTQAYAKSQFLKYDSNQVAGFEKLAMPLMVGQKTQANANNIRVEPFEYEGSDKVNKIAEDIKDKFRSLYRRRITVPGPEGKRQRRDLSLGLLESDNPFHMRFRFHKEMLPVDPAVRQKILSEFQEASQLGGIDVDKISADVPRLNIGPYVYCATSSQHATREEHLRSIVESFAQDPQMAPYFQQHLEAGPKAFFFQRVPRNVLVPREQITGIFSSDYLREIAAGLQKKGYRLDVNLLRDLIEQRKERMIQASIQRGQDENETREAYEWWARRRIPAIQHGYNSSNWTDLIPSDIQNAILSLVDRSGSQPSEFVYSKRLTFTPNGLDDPQRTGTPLILPPYTWTGETDEQGRKKATLDTNNGNFGCIPLKRDLGSFLSFCDANSSECAQFMQKMQDHPIYRNWTSANSNARFLQQLGGEDAFREWLLRTSPRGKQTNATLLEVLDKFPRAYVTIRENALHCGKFLDWLYYTIIKNSPLKLNAAQSIHGANYSVGGEGGLIQLSVRFAYNAEIKDVAGDELQREIEKTFKRVGGKRYVDVQVEQIRKTHNIGVETPAGEPLTPTGVPAPQPTVEGKRAVIVPQLEYVVLQTTSKSGFLRDPRGGGTAVSKESDQTSSRPMRTLREALSYLDKHYPAAYEYLRGKEDIINANIKGAQGAIEAALSKVAAEIAMQEGKIGILEDTDANPITPLSGLAETGEAAAAQIAPEIQPKEAPPPSETAQLEPTGLPPEQVAEEPEPTVEPTEIAPEEIEKQRSLKSASILEHLVGLATQADKLGRTKLADKMDELVKRISQASNQK